MSKAMRRLALLLNLAALLAAAVLLGASPPASAVVPTGFAEVRVATGLVEPTTMAMAPDGRIFIGEQAGKIRVFQGGALLAAPFLNIAVDSNGERGLLGIAFDPNFAANQFVYVYYTVPGSPPHNRVSRFTASGNVVVPGSELSILDLENLSATNHNGGAIHFGPDGMLYVAVGENANGSNSQTLSNRLGKLLRIRSDGTIPTDNPFYLTASGANRSIWALGLRNPYTFNFLPGSSRMFINDVGQATWEEINDGIAGSNYGWPTTEGPTTNPNFRSPLYAYGHGSTPTTGCAITGGVFYKPSVAQFPSSYVGDYFFADFCTGWIRSYDPASTVVSGFASGIDGPVDLLVGAGGGLFYLARGSGSLVRITYGAGHGLGASYYNNENFTGTTVRRVDSTINFNWGTGSPAPGIGPDTFSVRWTGAVQVPADGTYQFYTQTDDGVRLWVDGVLIVDNFTRHAVTENSGAITLATGVRHSIRMDYFDSTSSAVAKLLWSGPTVSKAIIPNSALYVR